MFVSSWAMTEQNWEIRVKKMVRHSCRESGILCIMSEPDIQGVPRNWCDCVTHNITLSWLLG
jgi:hypothetical protein